MSDLDFFYKNSFYLVEFKKTKNHQNLLNILKELYDYKINHGYRFEKKYASSEDFRPNIYSSGNKYQNKNYDQNLIKQYRALTI